MIDRAAAVTALAAEEFDVVVVGGGITGAGVALDAATRGYSVALVERHDFASGTSSRSSKLVHGGLRYLQNFDLGLVREALIERQIMVGLAPHLVKPLPLIVPAFDGARPDRMMGMGLNLYDVMSVDKLRSPLRRRGRAGANDATDARPRRPPGRPTATASSTPARSPRACRRSPRASRPRATSSTTARPTTAGSCSPSWARPSASARSAPTACWSPSWSRRAGAPAASACTDSASGEIVRRPGPERRQRHRRLGRPPAPRGAARRGGGPDHPALARHARHLPPRGPAAQRRRDRPGRRRALHLRAAVARRLAGRHDRHRLRRDRPRPRPARRRRRRVPARRRQRVLRDRADGVGHHRRLRGRPAADQLRRRGQVGGHLAQGRAV